MPIKCDVCCVIYSLEFIKSTAILLYTPFTCMTIGQTKNSTTNDKAKTTAEADHLYTSFVTNISHNTNIRMETMTHCQMLPTAKCIALIREIENCRHYDSVKFDHLRLMQ